MEPHVGVGPNWKYRFQPDTIEVDYRNVGLVGKIREIGEMKHVKQ